MTDEVKEKEKEQPVRYAKQDIPWPEDKLPRGTQTVDEQGARLALTAMQYRPGKHSIGDTALDVEWGWSDRHARMLIDIMWNAVKPGSSLFVPPAFPVQPDAPAKRAHLEGYKQYTKTS